MQTLDAEYEEVSSNKFAKDNVNWATSPRIEYGNWLAETHLWWGWKP